MNAHDQLVAWLNDAHAMELAMVPVLENHADDAAGHPAVRSKDLAHVEATRRHAERVRGCVERLGGGVSAVKSGLATASGMVQSVSTGPFRDELVKNFLPDYAAEHLEIGAHRALITAARELGDLEADRACEEILRDELEMAAWLEARLPLAVRATLEPSGAPAIA
jgi:ferritin-like metal-binding protein YciE